MAIGDYDNEPASPWVTPEGRDVIRDKRIADFPKHVAAYFAEARDKQKALEAQRTVLDRELAELDEHIRYLMVWAAAEGRTVCGLQTGTLVVPADGCGVQAADKATNAPEAQGGK